MEKNKNILVIIPARGGSKGIPRKNIRSLNGKPLISYSIQTAITSKYKPDVYVSSEDDEILSISELLGAKIHKRNIEKAFDIVTLDPVIFDAFTSICKKERKNYDIIVTLQPTSPLLKTKSLDKALEKIIENPDIDTIISALDDTHLTWRKLHDRYIPNYEKRVNRQYLTPVFRESGGFLITRSEFLSENNRIGKNVDLYILDNGEEIDIDSFQDWHLCEYYLKRKKILFVLSGYTEIGLGHAYNALVIANDILNHEIVFLVDQRSQLAFDKIAEKNFKVTIQRDSSILKDIEELKPDIIINDRLDTSKEYISDLKKMGYKVINFEDLGEGAQSADLVINAMYPEKIPLPRHYFGPKYFCIRDEFIFAPQKIITEKIGCVLLSFGGVDPNNFTCKVLGAIYEFCVENSIAINVVAGFGYERYDSLERFEKINIYKNANNIAEHMVKADIIFTSAGRTTYEAASIGTPTIVLAQNSREMTHFFASWQYGILNLGCGTLISEMEIFAAFKRVVEHPEMRKYMSEMMLNANIREGRKNVINLIKQVVEGS